MSWKICIRTTPTISLQFPKHVMRINPCKSRTSYPNDYKQSIIQSSHLFKQYDISKRFISHTQVLFKDEKNEEPFLEVPAHRIQLSFSRSSGPGGQNVNKVNTKAELRFKISEASWIPEDIRERFQVQQANRITKDDEFVITSEVHRYQQANIKECFDKLQKALAQAARVPKERIATTVPQYAEEERKQVKKHRSEIKAGRKKPTWDD